MQIAIISDIHDNIWNLKKVLQNPKLQDTAALLCCGDLCSPFIIKLLGQGYSKPIHIILGNNDGDVSALIKNANEFSNISLHGEYFRGELGGKTIAMNHYPDKALALAKNGGYDVVCYGHNHNLSSNEKVGDTLYINPGAIMGFHGGGLKEQAATFLILETDTLSTQVCVL